MNRITPRNSTLGIPRIVKSACLALAFCATVTVASSAQTYKTLVYFDGKNGAEPLYTALVQGTDGNLYGTTASTAFKMAPNGMLTTLHLFCAYQICAQLDAGLLLATDGNFYGVTTTGGSSTSCRPGCGTVFKLTPTGAMTVLHNFNGTDGSGPGAALVEGTDGSLYGTTIAGGSNSSCSYENLVGCGTVFKITTTGTLTTLYNFNGSDGSLPFAPLIQAVDGNYYGTTFAGGAYDNCIVPSGTGTCGTVFKITPSGSLTTLHSFNGGDGGNPLAPLYQASNENFYGTTWEYGESVGLDCAYTYPLCGTVFKITPAGELTTLAYLHGATDAGNPSGSMIRATDGNFYGTSQYAGLYGGVFEMTAGNIVEPVYGRGGGLGANPYGGLFQATNGVLYGTTPNCIYTCDGTVFSLDLGLGPFITFILPSGKVGGTAQILGQNLTRTTMVTFNGVPAASFKVISDTYLTAVVPTGATTGSVVVTNLSGTLRSNKDFIVTE
jgi:uncharacterized repeat protein (TIGR03803 family)